MAKRPRMRTRLSARSFLLSYLIILVNFRVCFFFCVRLEGEGAASAERAPEIKLREAEAEAVRSHCNSTTNPHVPCTSRWRPSGAAWPPSASSPEPCGSSPRPGSPRSSSRRPLGASPLGSSTRTSRPGGVPRWRSGSTRRWAGEGCRGRTHERDNVCARERVPVGRRNVLQGSRGRSPGHTQIRAG